MVKRQKDKVGFVYIADDDRRPPEYKIGYSKDLDSRVRGCKTSNRHFRILYRRRLPQIYERRMHKYFRDVRLELEWFGCTFEDAKNALDGFANSRKNPSFPWMNNRSLCY
jgi:hypothetical protein